MTDPVRVLLVDDEPIAREGLRELVGTADGFVVCGEAGNGRDALASIQSERPDVVLLDIQMPELDGFGVLAELPEDDRPVIVFVTAYEQYAVAAFEASATDYLLKPFDRDRLFQALQRASDRVREKDESRDGVQDLLQQLERRGRKHLERFVVKRQGRIVLVPVDEVDWIEAAGNYVYIHTAGSQHLLRDTLTHLQQELDPESFVRIHRSAMVRLGAISELERLGSGDYLVRLVGGKELTLSRSFRKGFEERVGRPL
ncbi:MAG: response regulator transcription factor [Planctomycetes bacterium]|nr:response regulator transcription factor [Planctomycetota bacterium]